MRIAAPGGTAFCLVLSSTMFASPVRADWSVKRGGSDALVRQLAAGLRAHPADRDLAAKLVRSATRPELERLLVEFGQRAAAAAATPQPSPVPSPGASPGPSAGPILAHAQLLLAAGQNQAAATAFAQAAKVLGAGTREGATPPAGADLTASIHEGWARALRALGDRPGAIAVLRRAIDAERRPARRRQLLRLLLGATGDAPEPAQEIAARRDLLALDPQDEAVALALVDALERAGQPGEAAQVLEQRVSALSPAARHAKVGVILRLVGLHETAGALDRAAALLAEISEGLPASDGERRREVWSRTIEVARRRGSLAELEKRLESPTLPRGAAEWQSLSEVRDELGDLEGALDAARRARDLLPRKLELGRRVAALLERLGRESEVTTELGALARLAPSDPRFTIELIERQFRSGRRDEARAELDHAIAKFGGNAAALGQLADLAGRWSESRRALDAWTRLLRLSPRDELAILGLGEVQFQNHKKEQAIHTWQALREGRSSRAEGCARLADVLMEHDLLDEATAEALQAQGLEPGEPRHRRLMAQILERQHRPEAAIAEWERVLAMNGGPNRVAERREARSRILGILSREGRARLDERITRLRAQMSLDPNDRETALFLAEAELRNDAVSGAIDTLRATITRDRQPPGGGRREASDDAKADVILTLVRLLRQTRQLDEAVRLLNELAQRIPARAREAHIQIADIELGRYEDREALEHASSAARLAPDDGRALVRIAEVQERAGEVDAALANYRRAFNRDANPTAAFALARLLSRRGLPAEAAEILRGVLRAASDEETITETGRRAIDLEEYLGSLDDLERVVSGLLFSNPNGSAYRRLLVEIYRRLLPTLYRAPADLTAAGENRARIAQHGLRPLLELLSDADGNPERSLIELLGMLGNRDAAPALARLAQGPVSPATESMLRSSTGAAGEVQLAAVVALGRLGDGRARPTVEGLVTSSDAATRTAAIWALGRMATPDAGDLLAANTNSHLDVAGFAYLGLGRTGDPRWLPELTRAALEPSLPTRIRRAAAVALGLSRSRAATPTLLALLDGGNDELASAAAMALGTVGDAEVLPALLERALGAGAGVSSRNAPALAAIDRLVATTPVEDEAKAIDGTRLDLDAMLNVLVSPPTRVDRTTAWLGREVVIERILGELLAGDRTRRLAALEVLDSREDGAGLGRLAPEGKATVSPTTLLALRRLAASVRGRIAGLLSDRAPEIRALSLRVGSKIGAPEVKPATILEGLATAPAALRDAAAFALTRHVAAHPESTGSVVRALAAMLADTPAWEGRLAAVEILAALGAPARVALESAATRDLSPLVRSAAVVGLGTMEGSAGSVHAAAGDPVPAVRAAAARALARHPTAPGTGAALSRLRRDPSDLVRSSLEHIEP